MNTKSIHNIALGGILTAAIILSTTMVSIPIPGGLGYLNLGDAAVFLTALLLDSPWGILCSGIASALSDLLLGYGIYAPASFLIKGGMVAVFLFFFRVIPKQIRFLAYILASLCVPVGYLLYESFLYGIASSLPNFGYNLIQGLIGAVIAFALSKLLKAAQKNSLRKR